MKSFAFLGVLAALVASSGVAHATVCSGPSSFRGVRVACGAPAPEIGAGLVGGLAALAGLAGVGSIQLLRKKTSN